MVIRAFVHLHKSRAAILCRQTKRQRVQVATPACRHGDADLHKIARQRRLLIFSAFGMSGANHTTRYRNKGFEQDLHDKVLYRQEL